MSQFAELYRNECYKFMSKEREEAEFRDHAERVRAVQGLLAQDTSGSPDRVFHAKAHAALLGRLTLRADRPAAVRHGLFSDDAPRHYNVLARFSNGVGVRAHDLKPDVRGLALKIFGADHALASSPMRARCVDWLMTNAPNPFGRDQDEFVRFMEAHLRPIALVLFLVKNPSIARRLFSATLRVVRSLAAETYWSGHAYLLGPTSAMKFNVTPTSSAFTGNISKFDPNYLSKELLARLEHSPVKFSFNVQLEVSPEQTPIEDSFARWEEASSPSLPVADLELTRIAGGIHIETLRFTPAHFAASHRPLGNLARGRLFTYAASQDGRAASASEPGESTLFPRN